MQLPAVNGQQSDSRRNLHVAMKLGIVHAHNKQGGTLTPSMNRQACRASKAFLHTPLAEGEGGEVFVNGGQQGLGARQAQGHVPHIVVLHVMTGLQVLMHEALACAGSAWVKPARLMHSHRKRAPRCTVSAWPRSQRGKIAIRMQYCARVGAQLADASLKPSNVLSRASCLRPHHQQQAQLGRLWHQAPSFDAVELVSKPSSSVYSLTQDISPPVEPKVSMAKKSPSSILTPSPPLTMGTVLPPWMLYRPIE